MMKREATINLNKRTAIDILQSLRERVRYQEDRANFFRGRKQFREATNETKIAKRIQTLHDNLQEEIREAFQVVA